MTDLLRRGIRSTIEIEGREEPALVFRPSRRRQWLFAAGATALSVFGVFVTAAPPYHPGDAIALLGVVVLGAVGLLRARQLRRGGEFLAFTERGIVQASWLGTEVIDWKDIQDVRVLSIRGAKLVTVRGAARSESRLRQLVRTLDRSVTGWSFAIGAASLGLPADGLRNAILQYVENPADRQRITLEGSGRAPD